MVNEVKSEIIMDIIGFKTQSVCLKTIAACFFNKKLHNRVLISKLVKIPKRYPIIPYFGTIVIIEVILIKSVVTFIIKVVVVFPRPFSILVIVVDIYKNGHINPRVLINLPAVSLLKMYIPISFPYIKNIPVKKIPRNKQASIVTWAVEVMDLLFLEAFASAIFGSNIIEAELVNAEGKNTSGIAIPVSIPYIFSASYELIPHFLRIMGIIIAS